MENFTTETVYLVCAIGGGTLMVCQFLMSLLGFGDHGHDLGGDGHEVHFEAGHDHDAGGHDGDQDAHHDHPQGSSSWFVGVLSFRAVVAALTFFGLAGMAGTSKGLEPQATLAVALAAAVAAVAAVATMMRSLHRLKADGTVRIGRAVGQTGTVYLTVPGAKAGVGKVTLTLQNRTVEYQAVTPREALPNGSKVVVVGVVSPDTVEVLSATEMKG